MTKDETQGVQAGQAVWHIAAADYYTLLSLLFQIPEPSTANELLDHRLADDYRAILSEIGAPDDEADAIVARLLAVQEELSSTESPLSTIRREYTRVFAHPRKPPIKLYEGLFIDDERALAGKEISYARLFVSPAAMDAERQYARAGVKCDNSEKRISADCITTELQFMSHLHTLAAKALIEGADDASIFQPEWMEDFKEKHVRTWMPRFFERCVEETQHDFYKLAGDMGLLLMKLDGVDAKCA